VKKSNVSYKAGQMSKSLKSFFGSEEEEEESSED